MKRSVTRHLDRRRRRRAANLAIVQRIKRDPIAFIALVAPFRPVPPYLGDVIRALERGRFRPPPPIVRAVLSGRRGRITRGDFPE